MGLHVINDNFGMHVGNSVLAQLGSCGNVCRAVHRVASNAARRRGGVRRIVASGRRDVKHRARGTPHPPATSPRLLGGLRTILEQACPRSPICDYLRLFGGGGRQLSVTMLKIDGSFVRDVLKDPRAESMGRTIAQLARSMSIATVAEYVETEELRARIATLGVTTVRVSRSAAACRSTGADKLAESRFRRPGLLARF